MHCIEKIMLPKEQFRKKAICNKYLICLLFPFLFSCNESNSKTYNNENNCESMLRYKLIEINKRIYIGDININVNHKFINYEQWGTIKDSCKNIILSDSILRIWDNACLQDIAIEYQKYKDSLLIIDYVQFKIGDVFHLLLAKYINNNNLIDKLNFQKGFYIIEQIHDGSNRNHVTILTNSQDRLQFRCETYLFSGKDWTYYPHKFSNQKDPHIFIDKYNFLSWLKKVKNKNNYNSTTKYSVIKRFIITEFKQNSVYSYYFYFAPSDLYCDFKKILKQS